MSNHINQAILKGMEVEAENRPQTMQEWLELLKKPVVAPPPPNPQPSNTIPSTPISKPQINNPQLNNNQQTPINPSRRKFIQTVGWVGAGLGVSVVAGKLITDASQNNPQAPKALSLQNFDFETVTVDSRGSINNRRKLNAKYFVEDLGNGATLEMVQIPGGAFTMGSPTTEAKRTDDESPQRQVTVPTFFMGRYQVTQAQYQAIIGNNPSNFKGGKRPVETVNWNEAVEFCKKLSQKTGRNYRLPSEAEWEYACRAGTTTPFYFGETITTDLVNYDGTNTPLASASKGIFRQETTEVGKFLPNAFGLYDMHGNIWEWCQDYWHDNYQGAPNDGSATLSGGDNTTRLVRGGSWSSVPENCRSAYRNRYTPDNRNDNIGFRLLVVLA